MSREIPLNQGYVAIVDDEDYDSVLAAGPWFIKGSKRGKTMHAQRNIPHPDGGLRPDGRRTRRSRQYLHMFLTGWAMTDHINGDGLDNRRENLRPTTKSLNNANTRLSRANKTGFKGVVRFDGKRGTRWRAFVASDAGTRYLGSFLTAEDAARAYDDAARERFGEFARLNFPRSGERAA